MLNDCSQDSTFNLCLGQVSEVAMASPVTTPCQATPSNSNGGSSTAKGLCETSEFYKQIQGMQILYFTFQQHSWVTNWGKKIGEKWRILTTTS